MTNCHIVQLVSHTHTHTHLRIGLSYHPKYLRQLRAGIAPFHFTRPVNYICEFHPLTSNSTFHPSIHLLLHTHNPATSWSGCVGFVAPPTMRHIYPQCRYIAYFLPIHPNNNSLFRSLCPLFSSILSFLVEFCHLWFCTHKDSTHLVSCFVRFLLYGSDVNIRHTYLPSIN